MKLRKFDLIILNKILKRGGNFFKWSPFFIVVIFSLFSCAFEDLSKYGAVSFHNTGLNKSFIFSVNEEFAEKNKDSKADEFNPKISEAEAKLLEFLLKKNDYCVSEKEPPYVITSKQEKIYDMTFAHLIEENYNARAIVPKTYFGRCR